MSETDTNGFSSEELTTSDWWIHQISDVPNWGPGGVFLVCTGPFASVTAAGAWFHTATGLFTEKMEKSFSEIVLIVPPGTKQLNYRDRFKASLKFSFERTGTEIPGDLLRYLDAADWPWVQSDAERVLERLQGLPQMSAVAIAGAERLRFQKLERVPGTLTSTHTGLRVSHSSADDLLLPHLHELLRQLLKLAKDHRLSIVVLVENFEYEPRKLPDDLRSHPELAVVSTRYSEAERSRYRATIEALEISRTSGLEAATQFVRQNIPKADRQAHAISYLYSNCGLWTQAWDVLDGHIAALRNSKEPNVLLNMAQAAGGCGEAKSACELLKEAFELGFETIESFNAAAILAKSIGATELLDQIIAEMRIAYPRHPMTVACVFGRLMTTAKYNEAAEMADAVGSKFDAAWARLRGQTTPDWATFITIGRETNNELDALAKCVYQALELGQSQKAREFFNQIPDTAERAGLRAELLFDILKKETGFAKTDDDQKRLLAEWSLVIAYLSVNTSDGDLRGRVLHWFETSADDLSRITILLQTMLSANRKSAALFEPANATNENSPWSFSNIEESSQQTIDFMRAVAESSGSCPLGRAVAPARYATGVSDEVMRGLGILIHTFSKEPVLKGIVNVLHCLNLACRVRREPSWDFEAAIQLTSALAARGKVSDALNLTESILLFWGGGEFAAARRAHAWSCKAEVYHRARNPLTSLLYLALCFESMAAHPAHQHATLLKHKLRLATRILRDLKFPELAGTFLAAEAKLIQTFPRTREEREWQVTEIGCRIGMINETTKREDVEKLMTSIQGLLEDEKEDEWGPPVSIALSALSLFRHYGFKVNGRIVELVQRRLPHCSSAAQNLFRYFFLERPSVGELQAAIHDMVQGNVHDDEGFALATMEGLLQRAITTACQNDDPEMFALAASWLSQPALAATRATREASFNQPEAQVVPLDQIVGQGDAISPQQMRDYAIAMQHQIERMESNFVRLPELPVSAAKYVAVPNEALCLLAHDADGSLCRLVVRRGGIERPVILPKCSWDAQKYLSWKMKYPHDYTWDQKGGDIPIDTPDENTIRDSLQSLQPGLPSDSNLLTILPESDLFGFSFFLTDASDRWLGEATTCATAPSLPWLAAVRQLPTPRLSLKAWLGDPLSADLAVLCPRSELKPFTATVGGTLIESATPESIGESGVSVILSHGSQGVFGGFMGVNDLGCFTNEELARWLGKTACVILFVCNAGRNDGRRFNQETFGIIGQLLRRGVRAVIAPPAPIRFDLPAVWFPSFYNELQQGKTVGQAYAAACGQIRQRFDHPCAWGALQLFGDAQLAFATGNSKM